MATLTGNQIGQSYLGLLKTTDNAAISATSKVLTDGAGNALTLSASTVGMEFTGNIDFTGATVTGVGGGGAAGFVAGTAPNSMKSADTLSDPIAQATGDGAIGIGRNARATAVDAVSVGVWSQATGIYSLALGNSAEALNSGATVVGAGSRAGGVESTVVGKNNFHLSNGGTVVGTASQVYSLVGPSSVIIGSNVNASNSTGFNSGIIIGSNFSLPSSGANNFIGIGGNISLSGDVSNSIVMGLVSSNSGANTVVIGRQANNSASDGTCVGRNTTVSATRGAAFGAFANASATRSVAIGSGVAATKADTTTVNKLEIAENGAGIILHSPNGTEYSVTITDGGLLTVAAV